MKSKLNPDYLKWIAKKEKQAVFSVHKQIAEEDHVWSVDGGYWHMAAYDEQLYTYEIARGLAALLGGCIRMTGKVKIELWRLGG